MRCGWLVRVRISCWLLYSFLSGRIRENIIRVVGKRRLKRG
jgi:hypothetical protein